MKWRTCFATPTPPGLNARTLFDAGIAVVNVVEGKNIASVNLTKLKENQVPICIGYSLVPKFRSEYREVNGFHRLATFVTFKISFGLPLNQHKI